MPFWYTQFGTTELPRCNASQDLSMGPAATAYSAYPYSVYDALGTEQAQVSVPYSLRLEATINSLNPLPLQTEFYAYRALQGTKALLYRVRDNLPTAIETVSARLAQFTTRRSYAAPTSLELTFEFDILKPVWSGTLRTDIITLAGVPETHTVTNSGNAIQRDVVLTIRPAGANLTDLLIENLTTGHVSAFSFDGAVVVANDLVIDCGVGTVRNNAVDAFVNFHLEAAHTITEWLRLAPGANSIRVTRTGGNAATPCTLVFNDAWA